MKKQFQSHIIAFFGTLLSLCLIFLLLWLLKMNAPTPLEDEGIVLTFGDAEQGGGMPEVLAADEFTQVEQIPAPTMAARPSDNDLMVQAQEESLALAKQAEEQAKRKAEQQELLRRRQEEMARQEAERIAQEKALAEQKAKQQEAIDKANQMAALLGKAGSTEGANANDDSKGISAVKGNPVGQGVGMTNGIEWTLAGRNVLRLPKPSADFTQEGKVKVQVWVDPVGNVTNAKVIEAVVDRHTQQLAIQAALKAKFSEGDTPQIGEITYIFKLN